MDWLFKCLGYKIQALKKNFNYDFVFFIIPFN